jgi:hypothetical protein
MTSARTWIARVQIVFAPLIVGYWTLSIWRSPIDPDYTAGELYDHALAWHEGGRLYAPLADAPYRVLNYPPAYLMVTRLVERLGIQTLAAGRLVGLAAFALTLVVIWRWLRRAGVAPGSAAALVACLASSYPALFLVGQLHLQWCAVLCSVAGVYLAADGGGRRAAAAGALCALACFFKHTQVVTGLIVGAWLLVHQRARLAAFVAGALSVGGAGILLLQRAFGPEIWHQLITYTVGTFRLEQLNRELWEHASPWAVLFAVALWAARDGDRRSLAWWWLAGSSLALFTSARDGAGPQYFIEWTCAILVWIGPTIDRWLTAPLGRPRTAWLVGAALVAQLVGGDTYVALRLDYHVERLRDWKRAIDAFCPQLGNAGRGLVPVEEAGMARACGRVPVLHPFIMTNLARRGLWDERRFVDDLALGSYPMMIVPWDPRGKDVHTQRWTKAMVAAIAAHYRIVDERGEWRLLKWTAAD